MPGQANDPTHVDSIACSGLHTSGKNPIGLRRRAMMMMMMMMINLRMTTMRYIFVIVFNWKKYI
jgi:hypothetical protein